MKKPLGTDVEELRADFESVRGTPFEHYYCPILHVDEAAPLCRGHVVPKSMGGTSRVLQRQDVDNGFGEFFEAEARDAIRHGLGKDGLLARVLSGNPDDVKAIRRRVKIETMLDPDGESIKVDARRVDGEAQFFVRMEDLGGAAGDLMGQSGVGLDARSSILVTALKSDHLSWFRKFGYKYVFSDEGIFVAWLLRSFYEEFIEPGRRSKKGSRGSLISDAVKDELNRYCSQFANFIRPLQPQGVEALCAEMRQGTLESNLFFVLWDGDQVYGKISVVKLGGIHVAVMTPVNSDARGWALIDLAESLELEHSIAGWNADIGMIEMAPRAGRMLVWPRTVWSGKDEETDLTPPMTIREAAENVIRSGRMNGP